MNSTPDNWQAARRRQAWQLKQHGWSQRQIAAALGVSEWAVSRWMTRARMGGPEALQPRRHPGAARRLTPEQLARLPDLLHRGAETYGFHRQVWTGGRVAAIIRLEFGICYHPAHVGRLLKAMHWSPQKPARQALSAIAAISPEGKLYFHNQDHAIDSADVVAFLEHLLREVPGRMLIIWDGAPIHRSRVIQEFLANGAAPRIHVERLPGLCAGTEPW